MTWYYNTEIDPKTGELKLGSAYLDRVQQVVDYALENGMFVILNSHHEQKMFYAGVSEAEIEKVYRYAGELWAQIAKRFKDYDEKLIFEAFNEIDNKELSWSYGELAGKQLNRMNQIFVDTVRKSGGNNAWRILMVPTLIDSFKQEALDGFELPKDTAKDRLIVQVHNYSQKFEQSIEADFELLEAFGKRIGAPVVIGEFGTTTGYQIPELREVHAANYISRAAAHGIKCIWWDNGSEYSIIDRKRYQNSNQKMIRALFYGLEGHSCEMRGEIVLNLSKQFVKGQLDFDAGKVGFSYWGTMVTDLDGKPVSVPKGSACLISLKAQGDASDIWIKMASFYDKDGNALPIKEGNGVVNYARELRSLGYLWKDIPEGTSAIRVSVHSPFVSYTNEEYAEFFKNGELELRILVFDPKKAVLN